MKPLVFIATLALLVLVGSGSTNGQETEKIDCIDRWLTRDKVSHLVLSAALVGFSYHLLRYEQQKPQASSRNLAAGMSLGFGLAKETRDSGRPCNHFSFKDLAADLLGVGLGLIIFTTK